MLHTIEERRDQPRLPASLMVQYASDSLALKGIAVNLSQTGLFMESDLLDMVGTRVWLQLSDGTWNWMHAVAEVVRTVETSAFGIPGMGLKFLELEVGATSWITQYCDAFNRDLRVVVVDADLNCLDNIGTHISNAGGRPLCLAPELLTVRAIERLRPHILLLGRGLPLRETFDLVSAIRAGGVIPHGAIYLAGPLSEAQHTEALVSGVADVIDLRDVKSLAQLVEHAARRLEHCKPPTTWIH